MITLDESRRRDIIRSDEYNDALSAIFEYGSRSVKNVQILFDDGVPTSLIDLLPALRGLLSEY